MDPELEGLLDRADELLSDLEDEFRNCLQDQNVTVRAKNLADEVLGKLRMALDHTMSRAWGKYIAPNLSEGERKRARVYFPIARDLDSFRSTLGRGCMADLDKVEKDLYDFILSQQPFSSENNLWLDLLAAIAAEGKHVRLTPQKRTETRLMKVSRPDVGSVSWGPSSVKFGPGVSVMDAPVDPGTQRIVPTPGVTEQVEIWVSLVFDGYGVNALAFGREACQKTRALIEEMVKVIDVEDVS